MNLVKFLAIIFVSVGHLSAFSDYDDRPVDFVAYSDIKKECYHLIYSVHRNLHIWEWPDSMVKNILKMNLEDYLVGCLDTPESRRLHLEYEAVDWNIDEMMRIHLSIDEYCDQIGLKN